MTLNELNEQITSDLMRKVEDDITAILRRVVSIAPGPKLPLLISAGAVCAGFVAAALKAATPEGTVPGAEPDPDCVLLAGLLIAHLGIGGADPVRSAYVDFALIKTDREAKP